MQNNTIILSFRATVDVEKWLFNNEWVTQSDSIDTGNYATSLLTSS